MKVFISSDMEGTAGIVDWEQVRPAGDRYEYFVDLLTSEVNAAITGAEEAGATDFLVNDSHGRMANLRPSALAGNARYLSGRFKPRYMMEGLDASFDAVFFVSYHGSMSAPRAALSHTYFPAAFAEVTLNGTVTGEAGLNALVAQAYQVPVVLITGDETTADELRPFCPKARAAVVKRSITRFAAESLHPTTACEVIRNEARQSLEAIGEARAPAIELPAEIGISFHNADYAELACRIEGLRRDGATRAVIAASDPLEGFTAFITAVLLCRGLVE